MNENKEQQPSSNTQQTSSQPGADVIVKTEWDALQYFKQFNQDN